MGSLLHRGLSLAPFDAQERLRQFVALVLERLVRWSGRRLGLVLVYHKIAEVPGDRARELVPALGIRLFESQLEHLRRRYRVVAASQLPTAVSQRRRGEPFPVAITFDDDLASHVDLAAPALRSAGLPATFFLCGASLRGPHTFWWEALQAVIDQGLVGADDVPGLDAPALRAALARDPFAIQRVASSLECLPPAERDAVAKELSRRATPAIRDRSFGAEHIRGLVASGFTLGFHTREHFLLTTLQDEELRRALRDGKEELEAAAGGITLLAYPHGKADERVAVAAEEAGYVLAFTGRREPVRPETNPLLIGRVEPRADSPGRFALELAGALRDA